MPHPLHIMIEVILASSALRNARLKIADSTLIGFNGLSDITGFAAPFEVGKEIVPSTDDSPRRRKISWLVL